MEQKRKGKPRSEEPTLSLFYTDSGNSVGKLKPVCASEQLLALGNLLRIVAPSSSLRTLPLKQA